MPALERKKNDHPTAAGGELNLVWNQRGSRLHYGMATKTLRTVKDSKFSGTFTKTQIDRAIRTVESQSGQDRTVQPDRASSVGGRHGGSGSSGGKH
jgi:hypothetical protein